VRIVPSPGSSEVNKQEAAKDLINRLSAIASSQLSSGGVAAAGALTPAVAAVCTSPRRRHATTTGLSGVLVRDLQMLLLRAVVQWHHLSAVGGADAAAAHDLDSGVGVFAVDPDLI
jgi:hypothetical protein